MRSLNSRFGKGDFVVINNHPDIYEILSIRPISNGTGYQYRLRDADNRWFDESELAEVIEENPSEDLHYDTPNQIEDAVAEQDQPVASSARATYRVKPMFHRGDTVRVRGQGNQKFTITSYRPIGSEDIEYFIKEVGWVRQADVQRVDDNVPAWRKRTEFLRDLFLAKMATPLTDTLYSYRASRTEFQAYQFKPLLKFLNNPDRRPLIADEVGLGKTIEAAIIYLELKARQDINRVLVVCPSRLTQKWQDELMNRFDEHFEIWKAGSIDKVLRNEKGAIRAIVSFETLRRQQYVDALGETGLSLDLLIVDEAHHMRNAGTQTYELGDMLQSNADAVLFLTATPLNLGERDLFNLMHLLAPEQFEDYEQFSETIEPNQYINQAGRLLMQGQWSRALSSLRHIEKVDRYGQFRDNPFYQKVTESLSQPTDDLETLIRLHRELLNLNTLASHFTRTRKREALDGPPTRRATPVIVTLSPVEYAYYEGILAYSRHLAQERHGKNFGFFVVTTERMAASCLPAAIEAFEKEQSGQVYRGTFEYENSIYGVFDDDDWNDNDRHLLPTIPSPKDLLQLGKQVTVDSKFDRFLEIIEQIMREDRTTKVLVFSSYRRTLKYLLLRLSKLGYAVDTIHGEIKIADRHLIIDQFRKGTIQILLSSEVGAEGLDFQFCHVMVNYDLPWNPMQVEQRIGRLDRFGQLSPVIRIFSLYIENTIETRIFQRLYDRIKLFEDSIGDLEAILGESIRELSRNVLQKDLTPEEQEKLAIQTAKRIEHQKKDQEKFEQERDNLLGQDRFLVNQELNYMLDSGRVIYPAETCAILQTYLKAAFNRTVFQAVDQAESIWYMELCTDFKLKILQYQKDNKRKITDGMLTALNTGHLRLTFDSQIAQQGRELEFVTPQHPFIEMARNYWSQQALDGVPATRTVAIGPSHEAGDGTFFVYAIDVRSAQPRRTLYPVILLDDGRTAIETARTLLKQLHDTTTIPSDLEIPSNEAMFEADYRLLPYIREQRDSIEQEAAERNEQLIRNRQASIERWFNINIRRAEGKAIENIREGSIRRLHGERDRRLKELDELGEIAVSYQLIAWGRVRIEAATPTMTQYVDEPIHIDNSALRHQEPVMVIAAEASLTEQPYLISDFEESAPANVVDNTLDVGTSTLIDAPVLDEQQQPQTPNGDERFEQLRNRIQRAANAMTFQPQERTEASSAPQPANLTWLQRMRGWLFRKEEGDKDGE